MGFLLHQRFAHPDVNVTFTIVAVSLRKLVGAVFPLHISGRNGSNNYDNEIIKAGSGGGGGSAGGMPASFANETGLNPATTSGLLLM